MLVQHHHRAGDEARAVVHAEDLQRRVQLVGIVLLDAAHQRVGVARGHHERGEVVGVAHQLERAGARHALAAAPAPQHLAVAGQAGVLLGVHDVDAAQLDVGGQRGRDDGVLAAQQDRPRDAFVHQDLRGLEDPLVVTLGEHQALGPALGAGGQAPDERVALAEALLELLAVRLQVQGAARDAALHGGLGHRGRLPQADARVERLGNEVVAAELQPLAAVGEAHALGHVLVGQRRERPGGGHLHVLGDLLRADVERPAEDEREPQDVVDLVGVVRPSGGDDGVRPRGARLFGHDLGIGVREREDDRVLRHTAQHLAGHRPGDRQTDEHVGADQRVLQIPRRGLAGEGALGLGEVGAARVHHALAVHQRDVPARHAEAHVVLRGRDGRGAGAAEDHDDVLELLADDFHGVEEGRARDDRRAVLVVVEDGDLEPLLERPLDLEALGRLDVLEVDAAHGGLEHLAEADHVGGLGGVDFDVEHVDVGERLEQDALALHHGLARERPDVAEAEHRGAVAHHGHEVAARGVQERRVRVLLDDETRLGHAGRIGQRQVALRLARFGDGDGDLAGAALRMVVECFLRADSHRSGGAGRCSVVQEADRLPRPRTGRY